MKKLSLFICAIFLLLVSMAQAGAVLQLGSPPHTGTYLYGTEVRPIDDTSLGILENGNGNPTLNNTLLLIIGVAFNETNSTSAPVISSLSNGSVSRTASGGNFTSGEIYSFLGLTGGNNSNQFDKWAAADLAVNGITATGFGIYEYVLTGTGITGGAQVDVTFLSDLALGTFAVAYGTYGDKVFSTPFTESGLTHSVPEPGMLLLFGSGLLGLGLFGRKNFRK